MKIPPRLLMCYRHWKKVPIQIQAEVYRTFRPGQEREKDPTDAWLKAAEAAINAVAAIEGKAPVELVERDEGDE